MFNYAVEYGTTNIVSVYRTELCIEVRRISTGPGLSVGRTKSLATSLQRLSDDLWEQSGHLPDQEHTQQLITGYLLDGGNAGAAEMASIMTNLVAESCPGTPQRMPWRAHAVMRLCRSLNDLALQLEDGCDALREQIAEAVSQEANALFRLTGDCSNSTWYEQLVQEQSTRFLTNRQIVDYVKRLEEWDPTLIEDVSVDARVLAGVAVLQLTATAEVVASAATFAEVECDEQINWYQPEQLLYELARVDDDFGEDSTASRAAAVAGCAVLDGVDIREVISLFCEEGEERAAELLDLDNFVEFVALLGNDEVLDPLQLAIGCRQLERECLEWYYTVHECWPDAVQNIDPADVMTLSRLRLRELVGLDQGGTIKLP